MSKRNFMLLAVGMLCLMVACTPFAALFIDIASDPEAVAALGLVAMAGSTVAVSAATGKSITRSKMFRVATEGATTDGRVISRDWITQMAANYDPKRYGARVNMEHIRGFTADGPFRMYGDVVALEAREVEAGKLGLFASIDPTDDLVALNKARQKIYTSIEVAPSFADTKEAYMVGLAVTDSPASLGTEVLSFAAQHPSASPFAARKQAADNLFTAATETVLEFEQVPAGDGPTVSKGEGANLFARVKELLSGIKGRDATNDTRFADVRNAVEQVANHSADTSGRVDTVEHQLSTLQQALKTATDQFAALEQRLSTTPNAQPLRPSATGNNGAAPVTDC